VFITQARVMLRQARLSKPYELSIGKLETFDSVIVRLGRSDGSVGVGEAVALPGYGWETTSDILAAANDLIADISGLSVERLAERCRDKWRESPFAASATMTALELPDWLHYAQSGLRFPLNAAVAPNRDANVLVGAAEKAMTKGFKYLKLKIGLDVDLDIAAMRILLDGLPGCDVRVAADANQAYTVEQSKTFLRAIEEMKLSRFLWLEQPLNRLDWEGARYLCNSTALPIVLDECIYAEEDIARAAATGARGVKLKLVKNLGLKETLRLAAFARTLGLFVVFGNGVATDVGNLAEFLVLASAPRLFSAPSESSGFTKLVRTTLPILEVMSGCLGCRVAADAIAQDFRRGSFELTQVT
jgi:L-alanine-DL-glutamate epimerase-like enolase superfamily enzyme